MIENMRAWSSYSIKEVSSSRKHERAYHQKRSCTISYKIHSSSKHVCMAFGCTISRGLKGTFNFDSKGLYVSKPILGIITTRHKMQARQNQHNNAIVNTMHSMPMYIWAFLFYMLERGDMVCFLFPTIQYIACTHLDMLIYDMMMPWSLIKCRAPLNKQVPIHS